ncbi:hypothetical protein J5N97_021961 [Dioscorea zingiberensis]|uniref:DUF4378 domain-containing protein n=1 Tax=Dioscorea zingiberensis TaxID=325984 RepID=A0A9D5CA37_9LILI|nr:hypothetical protein J5N97_021961 [Dioscorea zingiberensis]
MNPSANGAPMKKLIDEEMSNKTKAKHNTPSVVARLMGMEALPSETTAGAPSVESNSEQPRNNMVKTELIHVSSTHHTSGSSISFKQNKKELVPFDTKLDSSQTTKSSRMTKPQPREHPQEELLQKFKKEFEAWQASKSQERSRILDLDSSHQQLKENVIIAQKNLTKEKMARYMDAKRTSMGEISNDHLSMNRPKFHARQGSGFHHEVHTGKQPRSNLKDDQQLRSRKKTYSVEHLPISKFEEKWDRTSSPTRIVVLKPTSESDEIEESWFGTSGIAEKDDSMENFLQEVKERLRLEIQGKSRNTTSAARGNASKISLNERPTDTKHVARHIAKQIRESVTRDLGTTLLRSESTRSHRSEIQCNEPDSPEFINKDTRRILSERLKNVLKCEADVQNPLSHKRRSGTTLTMPEGLRMQQITEFSKSGKKVSYWEEKNSMAESKTHSFRREREIAMAFDDKELLSPRNLIRSFSAPVTGTAFAKLLLEDQHALTGAHIRRKHEASEQNSPKVRKNKKDGFSLKGKVSNLKQNLSLKGKLFGKKMQPVDKSGAYEFEPLKPIVTVPSVDNYTEVPPSPASLSSSPHDDFSRPGHPSPVSPLEAPFIEDPHSSYVSAEFSLEFPELATLSEQAENSGQVDVEIVEKPSEDETFEGAVEVEGHVGSYIRDILLAAGLYEGEAFNRTFLRWDALTKPIPIWVFDEVEETYSKNEREDNSECLKCCCAETDIGHKMLFDLLNEALPQVLTMRVIGSSFKRCLAGPPTVPRGKKLLDNLWHQIKMYSNPPLDESHSLDDMMIRDLKMTPWSSLSHEDIDSMGREMEMVIIAELIDEFVCEMCC